MLVSTDSTQQITSTNQNDHARESDYANVLHSASAFEQGMKMAGFLSKSTFIPKDFQNRPSDCLIALQIAASLGVSAFDVMNGIYVVHGRPAFSAKFAIALANRRGAFATSIAFETSGQGPSLSVTAFAKLKDTGETAKASITFKDAETAGWAAKNQNYRAIPEQMLCYKAAMMLIRRYCPEITMGLVSVEEAEDLGPISKENHAIEAINQSVEENKNE